MRRFLLAVLATSLVLDPSPVQGQDGEPLASGARIRITAEPAGRTTGTLLALARFTDRQRPALEGLSVELADHFFGHGAVGELDEREAPWPSGFSIHWQRHLCRLTDGAEMLTQLHLVHAVIQIPDEQPNSHARSLLR